MTFFGPNSKWVGRFGFDSEYVTLHFFPRVSVWGYIKLIDDTDPIIWHTFGLGSFVAVDWHTSPRKNKGDV